MIRYFFILLIPIWICLETKAQNSDYSTIDNIPYVAHPVSDYQKTQCVLDVYFSESASLKPAIVWFHGGGLTGGRKEIPAYLKEKGLVVIGVGYRLSPNAKVEEIIEDAAKAVAFVIKNSKKYHVDVNKIFISGHSAGGYLALMLGLNKQYLNAEGVDANQLAGIIPFSGQTITHFTARKEDGIDEKQPVVDRLAPLYWVRKDAPPIVLLTGDREKEMLGRYEENAYLKRMLTIVGHKDVKLLEFEGYGHDMIYPGFPILWEEIKRIVKKMEFSSNK